MTDPVETKSLPVADTAPTGRRATNGAWLLLVVLAAFAAFALLRQLG